MPEVKPDSAETCALLERIHGGDPRALEQLLERHRPALPGSEGYTTPGATTRGWRKSSHTSAKQQPSRGTGSRRRRVVRAAG